MGFFEILLIAIVALFVVGPERMPEAVRSVALTIGRVKRSFNSARVELEKQIGTDEIRRQLHNESVMESLGQIKDGLTDLERQAKEAAEDEYDYGPGHHHDDIDDEPKSITPEIADDKPAKDPSAYQKHL